MNILSVEGSTIPGLSDDDQSVEQFFKILKSQLEIINGQLSDIKSQVFFLNCGIFGSLLIFTFFLAILFYFICIRKRNEDNVTKKAQEILQKIDLMEKFNKTDSKSLRRSKFYDQRISKRDFEREKEFDKIYAEVEKEAICDQLEFIPITNKVASSDEFNSKLM